MTIEVSVIAIAQLCSQCEQSMPSLAAVDCTLQQFDEKLRIAQLISSSFLSLSSSHCNRSATIKCHDFFCTKKTGRLISQYIITCWRADSFSISNHSHYKTPSSWGNHRRPFARENYQYMQPVRTNGSMIIKMPISEVREKWKLSQI